MISEQAERFTVFIQKANGGTGSGVLIGHDKNKHLVLTATHVINDVQPDEEVYIITFDKQYFPLKLDEIQCLSEVDLALVSFVSNSYYPTASFAARMPPPKTEELYVTGFSIGFTESSQVPEPLFMFKQGNLTASTTQPVQDGLGLLYTNKTQPGMSGGPVLNQQGELIGIHSSNFRNYINQFQRTEEEDGIGLAIALGVPINYYLEWEEREAKKISELETSVELTAEDYLVRALARLRLNLKQFDLAIDELTQAIRLTPDVDLLISAYFRRGFIRSRQNNLKGAIRDYNQALKLNPNGADIYLNRGFIFLQKGQFKKAIKDYNQVLELNPDFVEAYFYRGLVRFQKKDLNDAIKDYNQALKLDPNFAMAHLKRGDAFLKQKKWKAAVKYYNQALALSPNLSEAYYKQGWIYNSLSQFQQAINYYNQAIACNPYIGQYYIQRGMSYCWKSFSEEKKLDKEIFQEFSKGMKLIRKQAKYFIFRRPLLFMILSFYLLFLWFGYYIVLPFINLLIKINKRSK